MIDLPCHMLPAIDDGPEGLDESVAMARYAVENGISKTVVTPHLHPGRYNNNFYKIYHNFKAFRKQLQSLGIPLNLHMAAEVRLGVEILPLIAKSHVPFLGVHEGYKILLLEMPHSHIPVGADKLVKHLISQGIKPLIAHPERNKSVMQDMTKIIPFLEMGCMLQLTSASLFGGFGDRCQQLAEDMLRNGWVSIIATDAHNINHRPPSLAEGHRAAAAIIGEENANKLVVDYPAQLISDKFY